MFSKKKGASWTYDTPSFFMFCFKAPFCYSAILFLLYAV